MTSAEVIITAIGSPAVLAIISSWLNARSRRADKKLDWEREDKVAEKAEKAATLQLASTEQMAHTADRVAKETSAKLEVIRVDVNSNMTAAMKAELDATVAQLILMRENVELKKSAGTQPGSDVIALIEAKEERINELKATLKDRLTHTAAAAAAASQT